MPPSLLTALSASSSHSLFVQLVYFSLLTASMVNASMALRSFQVVVHGLSLRLQPMVQSMSRLIAVVKSQSLPSFVLLVSRRILRLKSSLLTSTMVQSTTSTALSIRISPPVRLQLFSRFIAVFAQVILPPSKTLAPWLSAPSSTTNAMTIHALAASRLISA